MTSTAEGSRGERLREAIAPAMAKGPRLRLLGRGRGASWLRAALDLRWRRPAARRGEEALPPPPPRRPAYRLHEDFSGLAELSFRVLRYLPFSIFVSNLAGSLASALFRPPRDIGLRRFSMEGHQGGRVGLLLFEPKGLPEGAPLLLYFHGGAFVLKDFPPQRRKACEYARGAGCKVLFVRYRRAPRHPFPFGVEDCYLSLLWAREHAGALGIDRGRIGVGGDSAGGALAAAVALMARDRAGPPLRCQLLVYPVTDSSLSTPSMREFVDTPGWDARLNRHMWKLYLRGGAPARPDYAAPALAASQAHLPPAYVETEEFDCLRDEGRAYADRLAASGVPVVRNDLLGTFHGFDVFEKAGVVRAALAARIDFLRRYLSPEAWSLPSAEESSPDSPSPPDEGLLGPRAPRR